MAHWRTKKNPFYGIVELTGRVRNQVIQETFIVSQVKEDAILGMPFLLWQVGGGYGRGRAHLCRQVWPSACGGIQVV